MKPGKSLLPAAVLNFAVIGALQLAGGSTCFAQPDPNWLDHDRDRPQPPVVTPATASTQAQPGQAPSDATVLFDGKDLSQWSSMDGSPTKWITRDGYMECVKGSGYVRTLQNFGDCQLHVEWATPVPPPGRGPGPRQQRRLLRPGPLRNTGARFLRAKTYADGSAGAVYGQYPPLVNVCLPARPMADLRHRLYRAAVRRRRQAASPPPAMTVFQNGVLIQNNVQLTGPTSWLERAPYQPHPEKQPISLQDHGNPVRFRNIWVRELGKPGKKEFTLPDALLDSYAGKYDPIEITREGSQLVGEVGGVKFLLFAESPTRFFAKTTDVQIEFPGGGQGKPDRLIWSVGEGANEARRK